MGLRDIFDIEKVNATTFAQADVLNVQRLIAHLGGLENVRKMEISFVTATGLDGKRFIKHMTVLAAHTISGDVPKHGPEAQRIKELTVLVDKLDALIDRPLPKHKSNSRSVVYGSETLWCLFEMLPPVGMALNKP